MTRKKKQAATGWPYEKENLLESERRGTRSHFVQNSPWKRLMV